MAAAASGTADSNDSSKQSTVSHPAVSSLGQLYREARDGSSRRTDRCFNCNSMTDRARYALLWFYILIIII